jgi:hypothetical protein
LFHFAKIFKDLEYILNSQTGSSTDAVPPMVPLLPTTDPNLANFFSAIGGRFPTNLNSQKSNLVGLPQAAVAVGVPPSIPPPLGTLMATQPMGRRQLMPLRFKLKTNKLSIFSYCLKILQVVPGEPRTPVSFPSDASIGADIPK